MNLIRKVTIKSKYSTDRHRVDIITLSKYPAKYENMRK